MEFLRLLVKPQVWITLTLALILVFGVLAVTQLSGQWADIGAVYADSEEEEEDGDGDDGDGDEVGVRVFRVADINTPGGTAASNVGELIEGAEFELERTAAGVSMELETSGLPPGPYTLWWAVDNDNDPGTGGAPGAPLVTGVEVVRQATGGFVGANGKGEFEATLSAGPFPPANGATVAFNIATGDFDPMGAGIAVVIRYHGPVIPGAFVEQTGLFAGGCKNTPILELPGALPGGNVCFDPQVTEFARP